jgi:hypothetical protein
LSSFGSDNDALAQPLGEETLMNVKLSQIIGQPVIDISTSVKDFMKSKIDKMEVDAAFMAVNLTSIIQ